MPYLVMACFFVLKDLLLTFGIIYSHATPKNKGKALGVTLFYAALTTKTS